MYNLVDESTFTLQRGLEFLANAYVKRELRVQISTFTELRT